MCSVSACKRQAFSTYAVAMSPQRTIGKHAGGSQYVSSAPSELSDVH